MLLGTLGARSLANLLKEKGTMLAMLIIIM